MAYTPTPPTSTAPAPRGGTATVITPEPQDLMAVTFGRAIANNVDTSFFTLIQTGTGQTVNQTGGNLILTSGTTVNSETIIRSVASFSGSLLAKVQTVLSQRIINNNFYVELVDVIGDALALTVNSVTSITVTIPSNPFTSANVGQAMYVGAVSGITTAPPGRYLIASVAGNNVTFTVAGWSATGSGTCSLFGWNYYQQQFTSTTATSVNYDAQRNGYNSGFTAATINTTASPGTLTIMGNTDGSAFLADSLVASAAVVQTTMRASRLINLARENVSLFLQIRSANGTTAPASTTTLTIGAVSVENYSPVQVTVNDIKAQSMASQVPVAVTNIPAVTVNSGTITTVSTVSSVTALAAMNSVATTNGLSIGTVITTTTPTTTSVKGTAGRLHLLHVGNPNSTAVYVKVFNVAAPTLGTTSANMNFYIPATSSINVAISDQGLFFSTAIVLAVTGGASLTDNTVIVTGCNVNYSFI